MRIKRMLLTRLKCDVAMKLRTRHLQRL